MVPDLSLTSHTTLQVSRWPSIHASGKSWPDDSGPVYGFRGGVLVVISQGLLRRRLKSHALLSVSLQMFGLPYRFQPLR
ncbi:hypothetical protein SAMN04487963_3656 [Marinobacter zhejiangensis]|uniref:Uncharacterized protein n=1 Tax=Marinobacter zhejiangensis TaxID=488535 RepID=A0A1I4TLX9_9GAMM|nr:hypothetical protein SAMN04487963_3656 [Marinobacter zhejiangensis]